MWYSVRVLAHWLEGTMISSTQCLLSLICLGLCVASGTAFGEEKQTAAIRNVVVLQGTTTRVEMSSRRPIRTVRIENDKCVQILAITRAVLVKGVAPGTARLFLTDAEGEKETIEVEVRSNTLTISVGGTVQLQMTKKQPIKTIINERDDVIHVLPIYGDPTSVLVIGRAQGRSRITLVGADGKKENIDFGKPRPRPEER